MRQKEDTTPCYSCRPVRRTYPKKIAKVVIANFREMEATVRVCRCSKVRVVVNPNNDTPNGSARHGINNAAGGGWKALGRVWPGNASSQRGR